MTLWLYGTVTALLWIASLICVWIDWQDGRGAEDLIATGLLFFILACGWPLIIPVGVAAAVLIGAVRFVLFPVFNKLFSSYIE